MPRHKEHMSHVSAQERTRVMRVKTLTQYAEMIQNADLEFDQLSLVGQKPSTFEQGARRPLSVQRTTNPPSLTPEQSPPELKSSAGEYFVVSGSHPSTCIICVERFSETCKPPALISLACFHEPSVCSDCLVKYCTFDTSWTTKSGTILGVQSARHNSSTKTYGGSPT